MHSKRKLIISLSALAVTAVIAVVAVIAVLAASQQTLTSSINVQYIAKDVSATVSARYYIIDTYQSILKDSGDFLTDGGDDRITFDTESDYAVPPTLQPPVDTFNLESIDEYIYFEYKFTNNSSTSYIKLTPGFDRGADNSNMNEDFWRGNHDVPEAYWGEFQVLGPNQTMYATLLLNIQEAKDDANYSLNLTWNMTKASESEGKQAEFEAEITNGNAEVENGVLTAYNGDLTEIYIPDSVTLLTSSTFGGNTNITYVYIPNTTVVSADAFAGCTNLREIEFEQGNITEELYYAFKDCTNLQSINLDALTNLTLIGNGTFIGCSSLTEITIPETVKSISSGDGESVFDGCTNLTITIEGENTWTRTYVDENNDYQELTETISGDDVYTYLLEEQWGYPLDQITRD